MTRGSEENGDDGSMIEIPIQVDGEPEDHETDEKNDVSDQPEDSEAPPPPMEETPVQKINRATVIMRDGNEIQRISIVRNLPSLMNEDADECLIKLIPVVQDVLCGTGSASAGLELHFEASQAYKDIIVVQHQRLQRANALKEQGGETEPKDLENNNGRSGAPYSIDLGLCSQILRGIAQNIEAQDSIACTAWLDTLLEVVDHLPLCLIRSRVLPMAVQKAQQLNSIQARLTATKLFGRLTTKLEPNEVKSEIVPLVQALCQDSDAGVRASVCQQLPLVTRCLQLAELNSIILPLVIEFSKDEDEVVREANLETLAALIESFDDETCGQVLVPLVKKFVDDVLKTIVPARKTSKAETGEEKEAENEEGASQQRHCSYTPKSVSALAKNYGLLCHSLERYLSFKQKRWFIERFCELASVGADEGSSEDSVNNNGYESSKMDYLARKQDLQNIFMTCRRHAAYNFPAMVQIAAGTPEHLVKELMLPQFKRLCQDSETDVRVRVAAGFHEFAKCLGDDAALLIDSFVDLVYSGDPEVISSLTAHLAETLECIYGAGRATCTVDSNGNVVQQNSTSFTQLTRILLACNRLIRNGSNWRCHEQLLAAFACLSQFITNDELCQSFVPMMKEEVVNARAVPCRIAALRTLVKWTRDLKRNGDVQSVVTYCIQTLANNRSCHKRVLFLDGCEMFIEYLSKQFFKEHLFNTALQMVNDPVLNVRLKFCKLLPLFKSSLTPSADSERLTTLENAVKTLLNTDNQGHMGEIVKKVINELAHADAVDNVITAASSSRQSISPPKDKQPVVTKPPIKKKAEVAPMPVTPVPVENGKATDYEKADQEKEKEKDEKETSKTTYSSSSLESKATKRSPSPPNRRTTSTTAATTTTTASSTTSAIDRPTSTSSSSITSSLTTTPTKKTAVVQPRQVLMRSPSPRPPLNQYTSSYQKDPPAKTSSTTSSTTTTTSSTTKSSTANSQNDTIDTSYKARPPRPSTSTTSSSYSSPSSTTSSTSSRTSSSTASDSATRNLLMKSASSSSVSIDRSPSNERIVPIRMVESTSSSASLRPPTPVTYRRTSRDSGSSLQSPVRSSSSTTSSSSASSSSTSRRPSAASQVRTIPVIRTGTVSKAMERFETTGGSTRDRDSDLSLSRRLSNSSSSSGLGYSRTMNRSFSAFGRNSSLSSTDNNNNSSSNLSSLDSRKDYLSSPSPLRRSTYSTSTLSSDRSPYSLTKVRSGSSLASSALGRSSNVR